jgi:NitT/TauT family transport system substrate-binding protein
MSLRIMVSRHSAFYSPLISTIAAGFLERQGLSAEYAVLGPGQHTIPLIREGAVDIMQSAVSLNWKPMQEGESSLPVHFAQINQRDGFFLVAREPDAHFDWKKLASSEVLADHGGQPLTMLKYAARTNGLAWGQVKAIDAGAPEEMAQAFRNGRGAYVHLQSPDAHQLECDGVGRVVASVGASMPPVAFSSLCCSREFAATASFRKFLEAFREARAWVQNTPPEEVAGAEMGYFKGHSKEALAAAIRRYQALGCWEGGLEIPQPLYEQALTVFQADGGLTSRPAYEEVCVSAE